MREDDFVEKIASITNLGYFHQCQIHAFKKEIEVAFKTIIQYSCIDESTSSSSEVNNRSASGQQSKVDGIGSGKFHYKSTLLEKCLHSGIGWKSLCRNHDDESQKKSSSHTSSLSPLAIILKVLVNQSIIPSCFTHIIVVGLFHVAEKAIESQSITFAKNGYQSKVEKYLQKSLTSSSKRNLNYGQSSKSLNLIYSTMQSILSSRHHVISLSNSYSMYISKSMCFKSINKVHRPTKMMPGKEIKELLKTHYSDAKTSVAIEMILFLRNIFLDQNKKNRYTTWSSLIPAMMSILKLLNQIDDLDIAMLRYRQRKLLMNKSQKNRHLKLCKDCEMLYSKPTTTTTTTRKRNVATSQLSALHGELSDNEEQQYVLDLRRKPNHMKTYNDNHAGSCSLKELVSESKQIKKSLKDKQSCYVCMVKQNRKSSHTTTALPVHLVYFRAFLFHSWVDIIKLLSRNNRCDILKSILYQALSMTFKSHESSSLRYCTILIAHHYNSKNGYKGYLEILLSHFRTNCRSPSKESKARVFLDLYCEIIMECSFFDNPNECWLALKLLIDEAISIVDSNSEKVESGAKQIIQSVGYIFLKRNFIHARNISPSFNEYIVKCSDLFCNADHWMHPMMNDDDRSNVILMLQQLGILSFLQSNFDDVDNNNNIHSGNGIWPFLDSVRNASKRIGPKVQCQNLLSIHPSFAPNDDQSCPIITQAKRNREDSITDETSILDFLNEDITRHIFSFLGYKLLVRVTAVCKLWNAIGNENCFWEAHYRKRFNIVSLDDFLPSDIDEDLKMKFTSKYCDYSSLKWRQLFNEKWKKERSLRSKSNQSRGSGFTVKTCNVLGCLTVLSSAKRNNIHICMHKNNVLKKVRQLQRSKDRDEKRKLKKRKLERLQDNSLNGN